MKLTAIAIFAALLFAIDTSAQTPKPTATPIVQEEEGVVKVESRLVVVPVSVSNAAGEPVLGLKADDFTIAEENRPQVIDSVGNAEVVPLEIALLFDVSATTFSMFKFQQEAAAKFLREVLRPDDRATIFTIGMKPVLIQGRDTAEKAEASIRTIVPTKEQTAFYDSVRFAAENLRKNSPEGRRKVLLVISDGEDTNSEGIVKALIAAEMKVPSTVKGEELRSLRANAREGAKIQEQLKVLKALQNADAVFYSINPGGTSIQLNRSAQFGQENLRKFADDTGGTAFLPKFQPIDTPDPLLNSGNLKRNTATLEAIFKQLANDLRAQYLVQYYSESDFPANKFVKLTVNLKNRPDLRIRARQGYYVKK